MSKRFSAAVEKALSEVCPSDDPVDHPDFDPVAYLNERFPDELSLKDLPAFYEDVRQKKRSAEADLLDAVKRQATTAGSAAKDLEDAQTAVKNLHHRVSEIKIKAAESEAKVQSLCSNIRQLDIAKTNLSTSVKTLKKLQLWMVQVQSLQAAAQAKNFADCKDYLQAALESSEYFSKYKDVPKIKELRDLVSETCKQLAWHIQSLCVVDYGSVKEDTLREACLVADIMGPETYKQIVKKFIEKEMEVYATRFKRGTDDARFEKTERRYIFIRTLLDQNEVLLDQVFPLKWCVKQELCLEFCLRTRTELSFSLREAAGLVDVAVLTYVLQKTIEVEKELTNRCRWSQTFPGRETLPDYKYANMLLQCFDEHMSLYVKEEENLMRRSIHFSPESGIPDGEFSDNISDIRLGMTLPSSDDIFVFVKESLKRASSLSQKQTLVDVCNVWLREFDRYVAALTHVIATIPTTAESERRICVITNTAERCRSTTDELGMAMLGANGRLDTLPGLAFDSSKLTEGFQTIVDKFSEVYGRSVLCIVAGVEKECAAPLLEFTSGAFQRRSAGDADSQDRSQYVTSMRRILEEHVLNCATVLNADALRYFLDKLAAKIIPSYANGLFRLRRVDELVVNQLRLDCKTLEACMLRLPNVGDPQRFPQSALSSYTKRVQREFDRLDRALKVLQCEVNETFVEMYFTITIPTDRSVQHFSALLELKGVRGEDLRPWLTALRKRDVPDATKYDAHIPVPEREPSNATTSVLTATKGVYRTVASAVSSDSASRSGFNTTNLRETIDKKIVAPMRIFTALKGEKE